MTASVTIVDYGVGNLRSVMRAFEHVGANVELTSDPKIILKASRLVLPGVGAFGHCMDELRARGLIEPVMQFAHSGKPFLGICVGMQIMLAVGEEFGEHHGLGLISGRVQPIPKTGADGKPLILPSIGWMPLSKPKTKDWKGTILEGMEGDSVYFVHSYTARPDNGSAVLAEYDYHGIKLTAAIAADNLVGLQFHPEKSAATGIRMIERFSKW